MPRFKRFPSKGIKQHIRQYVHWDDDTLRELILEDWGGISMDWINARIDSIPLRLQEVIDREDTMIDKRRINGPSVGTSTPLFFKSPLTSPDASQRSVRTRQPNTLRKIFLKTGVTPSASGSAYLELSSSVIPCSSSLPLSLLSNAGLKVICAVHGPRALPRSAPFSPAIILSTHVKYAPFATRQKRSYLRNTNERDLALHLESALRGVIIGDRWPKSGVEVIITILESEDEAFQSGRAWGKCNTEGLGQGALGMMNILSGCITVASAAIADAGIDCVDMVSGGVAAVVRDQGDPCDTQCSRQPELVLDPSHHEHLEVLAACVVGYLPFRDEITSIWVRGELVKIEGMAGLMKEISYEELTEKAVQAALGAHRTISAAVKEGVEKVTN